MSGPRSGSDFDDLANDYRKASEYDPYHAQRLEERRQAKLARAKPVSKRGVEFNVAIEEVRAKLRKTSGKSPSRAKAQREPHTSIAKVVSDRGRKNSRLKGNRGELDVAEMFSKWCGEIVRRTPGSGGWGGAKEFGTTADLVCKKKAFPFHVEVKHREGWTLDDLVTGVRKSHDKSILQWWIQCTDSCPNDKMPLLVFRRNRQPWLAMLPAVSVGSYRIDHDVIDVVMHPEDGSDARKVSVLLLSVLLDNLEVSKGLKNYQRVS